MLLCVGFKALTHYYHLKKNMKEKMQHFVVFTDATKPKLSITFPEVKT